MFQEYTYQLLKWPSSRANSLEPQRIQKTLIKGLNCSYLRVWGNKQRTTITGTIYIYRHIYTYFDFLKSPLNKNQALITWKKKRVWHYKNFNRLEREYKYHKPANNHKLTRILSTSHLQSFSVKNVNVPACVCVREVLMFSPDLQWIILRTPRGAYSIPPHPHPHPRLERFYFEQVFRERLSRELEGEAKNQKWEGKPKMATLTLLSPRAV